MYYLFKYIRYKSEDKDPTPGVYVFEKQSEAIANFHQTIGNAMKQSDVAEALAAILNDRGEAIKRERYVAEVVSGAVIEGIE